MGSLLVRRALDQAKALRGEYQNVLESQYARAVENTNGRLLNQRGMKKQVDAFALFSGNATHAYAYASEELVEHWTRYPRLTYAEYERQSLEPDPWTTEEFAF